jgi:hypothetical protein
MPRRGPAKFAGLYANAYNIMYAQHPPIAFLRRRRWIATNAVPGHGITAVLLVQSNDAARERFELRFAQRMWGAFPQLPAGADLPKYVRVSIVDDANAC